jgi:transposase
MEQKVRKNRLVELLTMIPGAGLIPSSMIRAYVDDIGRFYSCKQFACYVGLVTWSQSSQA